jgi:CheY-like chemotaxis protein
MSGTPTPGTEPASRAHILLVEDDVPLGEAYSKILRDAGFAVSLAVDFRLALQVLEAERPLDLLIADVVMPGSVNGFALSRMARMRRRDLKVLYLTGYHIPGADQEALGPILRKPFEAEDLLREVESMLAG